MHEASTVRTIPYNYSNDRDRNNFTRVKLIRKKPMQEAKNMRICNLNLDDCMPMPEVERKFYNHFDYLNLRKLIQNDGYDRAYPIRVLWNSKKKVYEIFDGIHRWKILKDLGTFSTIPVIDETGFLNRTQAIAKGIKANEFRAPYNPIDLARSLKALGENFARATMTKSKRPRTVSISEVAELMRMSMSKVSQLFQLLKLPKDVQDLIGEGKLKFKHATELTRLLDTHYENKIQGLAEKVIEVEMPVRELKRIVEAIKHKGYYGEETICRGCKRVFPSDSISKPPLCPDCIGKLRSGELEKSHVESHNEARRKYLKFKAFVETHFSNDSIPEHLRNALDLFYNKWKGSSEPTPKDVQEESFMEYVTERTRHD